MNYFFISDLHFGHQNIITYSQRPYKNVEEMNESIITNYNKIVKNNDIVFNLGDVSFQKYNDFKNTLRRLNGKINLILGNHDRIILDNQEELIKEKLLNNVQHYLEFTYNKQLYIMSHFAFRTWNQSHKGSIALYGHSHGSLPPYGKSVDVGIDCKEITSEYRPISLEELNEYMKDRSIASPDHHQPKKK